MKFKKQIRLVIEGNLRYCSPTYPPQDKLVQPVTGLPNYAYARLNSPAVITDLQLEKETFKRNLL